MAASGSIDIFLQPGEYFCGDAAFRVRTLLGSCVSITLWHPGASIGAMSHFLLPSRPKPLGAAPDARYGEEALQLMLQDLRRQGIGGEQCQAKIFGGGNMFPGRAGEAMQVGKKNGEAARRLLAAHGISLVSENLFGNGHRQVVFDIRTGRVWSRQIAKLPGDAATPCEAAMREPGWLIY